MRIVSLLPSLTDLVCSLGRGDELVGVTHECDFPPGVEFLPRVVRSRISDDASSVEIDRLIAEQGGSLYELDLETLAGLRPTLILTQEQCDVCAINESKVRKAAADLPGHPAVESVNPTDLESVFEMFRRIGDLLGSNQSAEKLIDGFHKTVDEIDRRIVGASVPKVLILEWIDPPFSSGHWNPELIDRAGGREVIGQSKERSKRITWGEVAHADPEIILVAACGLSIDRAEGDLMNLTRRSEWQTLRAVRNENVYITDGSAYFSRPGPRLEASLRIAAEVIHPDRFSEFAPENSIRRIRGVA
ncbi:cobalamin-binding protein [Tundrisphaera lichenicola]|uniref:cobalamin-binding protein n=1 Tax=Tundrisphaera lichenicola TaxID=2029860 RepID=UPI003EBB7551